MHPCHCLFMKMSTEVKYVHITWSGFKMAVLCMLNKKSVLHMNISHNSSNDSDALWYYGCHIHHL